MEEKKIMKSDFKIKEVPFLIKLGTIKLSEAYDTTTPGALYPVAATLE